MRKSFLILVACIALVVVGSLVIASRHRHADSNPRAAADSRDSDERLVLKSTAQPDQVSANGVSMKPGLLSPQWDAETQGADKALQLVNALSEVSLRRNELTLEMANNWKRNLEQLIEQGKAAVPVLDEFFQSNGDFRLDAIPGGNLLEEPTLRIAFLKVLFDIPTPDNVELQERVLRTTKDPNEIALLARQLELQEPGEHREVIIEAARAALQMAGSDRVAERDMGPLVKLLADYGVPSVK